MKRGLILISGLLLLTISFGGLWFMLPTNSINAANFDRIEVGMTQQEVGHRIEVGMTQQSWPEILGLGQPDQEDVRISVPGDESGICIKCWHQPGRNTILVYFEPRDGRLISYDKHCILPTLRERATDRWDDVSGARAKGRNL